MKEKDGCFVCDRGRYADLERVAVSRALETRETEDSCRFEDLRIAAIRRETGEGLGRE